MKRKKAVISLLSNTHSGWCDRNGKYAIINKYIVWEGDVERFNQTS